MRISRRSLLRAGASTGLLAVLAACADGGVHSSATDRNGTGDVIGRGRPLPAAVANRTKFAMVGDSITKASSQSLTAALEQQGFTDITIEAEVSRRIDGRRRQGRAIVGRQDAVHDDLRRRRSRCLGDRDGHQRRRQVPRRRGLRRPDRSDDVDARRRGADRLGRRLQPQPTARHEDVQHGASRPGQRRVATPRCCHGSIWRRIRRRRSCAPITSTRTRRAPSCSPTWCRRRSPELVRNPSGSDRSGSRPSGRSG